MADEKKKATDYILPGPRAAQVATRRNVEQSLAAGQYAQALGAAFQGPVRTLKGVADDVVINPGAAALGGIARFAGGLFGTSNPGQTAARAVPVESVGRSTVGKAFSGALNAGTKILAAAPKEREPTPQERLLAAMDTRLRHPLTMQEMQALSGMMPAPAKALKPEDQFFAQTAALGDRLTQLKIAGIANADMSEDEKKLAVQKTLEEKYTRDAALLGSNPVNLMTAQMLNPTEDE